MANHDYGDIDTKSKEGIGLILGLAALAVGGAVKSSSNKSNREKLQQELNEVNHQLSVERGKFFVFRDENKIARLEARKREILKQLG